MPENTSGKIRRFKMILQIIFSFVLVLAIIFIPAGHITYWQGWGFVITMVVLVIISALLFLNKTDLIQERQKPGPGTKWWDKIFYAIYVPAFFAIAIIASLDVGRFGWTGQLPASAYILGYLVFLFANFMYLWSMWVNRFFSSTVRIQEDRGQKVVQEGPYRLVRHPGYVGGILLGIGTALVLGSMWALIPAGIVFLLLIIRTYLEDTTLQKELAGYTEYTLKVKYRLVPGLW